MTLFKLANFEYGFNFIYLYSHNLIFISRRLTSPMEKVNIRNCV